MSHLSQFRSEKDAYFGNDPASPLTDGQRERFNGLSYFDEAPELALRLTPSLVEDSMEIEIPLSTGGVTLTHRWATVMSRSTGNRKHSRFSAKMRMARSFCRSETEPRAARLMP